MNQEVQVTLTLEVDVTQSREDIEKFVKDLINTHTFNSTSHNKMLYPNVEVKEIKEEAELYGVEEEETEIPLFPNGFRSWTETFFEVTDFITRERGKRVSTEGLFADIQRASGTCGFWDLAHEWTNEFEKKNSGREWDGEFYEEVEEFCITKTEQ